MNIDKQALFSFCRAYHIKRLGLFGSLIKGGLGPDSDIDVLVEFEPGHVPGYFDLASMEKELSRFFSGRKIDMRTPNGLSRYFRDEVLQDLEVLYVGS